MKNKLTDSQIVRLKELHGDDKVAAFLEVANTIESGVLYPAPSQEEADEVAKRIMRR